MAITKRTVQKMLDGADLTYTEVEENQFGLPILSEGNKHVVLVHLDENGEYLAFRVLAFGNCKRDHSNVGEVLSILATANYKYRLVKFAWDPEDGDIQASASLPLEDNDNLTSNQFNFMLALLISVCDEVLKQVKSALEKKGRSKPSPRGQKKERQTAPSGAAREGGPSFPQIALSVGVLLLGLAALFGVILSFYAFTHQ